MGSNEVSAVDPKSISVESICENPKVTFLKPTVGSKRLCRNPSLINNKSRGGRGSRKFGSKKPNESTLSKCEEIIPVPESFKNESCCSERVPGSLKVKFDLKRESADIVSIIPVRKFSDPIVGGVPCGPVVNFEPSLSPFDFDGVPDIGFGHGINGSSPTEGLLYKTG
jgi:hypothetical protein